jgi:hypothetical protein
MVVVKITRKDGQEYKGIFESQQEAEEWVKNHKAKGKDKRVFFSPHKLANTEVIGEEKTTFGITYKLEEPAEYTVEYFNHDVDNVDSHWKALKEKRKEILKDTDWSQLSDVGLSTEERLIYREYRKYVRNVKLNYKDETVHNWKILSYKEFKQKKYPK